MWVLDNHTIDTVDAMVRANRLRGMKTILLEGPRLKSVLDFLDSNCCLENSYLQNCRLNSGSAYLSLSPSIFGIRCRKEMETVNVIVYLRQIIRVFDNLCSCAHNPASGGNMERYDMLLRSYSSASPDNQVGLI